DVDSLFGNAGTQAGNTATALRNQATNISKQAQSYQQIYDSLDALSANEKLPEAVRNAIDHLKTNVGTTITQLNDLASALNGSADNIDAKVSDTTAERAEIKKLAQQAATSVSGIKTDYESQLKPQLDDIATSITSTATALNATAADLKGALGNLNGTTKTADKNLTAISSVLDSTADSLAGAGKKLGAFTGTLTDALNSGDMSAVKDVLSDNTDSLAAALAAPVKVKRNAVFPVKNFGSQMAPFYTILPLWVGSLLMAVTLKTTVSRKVRKELGDPKPHQLFLGHYGVFGVIGLLQSTFSLGGSLLFLHVQAVNPLLFMLSGWVSSLVFSFFIYTLVASFGNVGKAIGVLFLVMQISGANGAYPLAVLPKIISGISPFLPATHSITAMRAAIGGIYSNDYWFAIGTLLLFIPPLLLIGLLLRIPLVKFNHWYVSKLESTKVIAA
ncbi:YhgE/Pip family protein, partial [Bifidobacterium adolescentis]